MKRILDTVHGYIMVEDHFIEHIIDTRWFQRLRRIEQTSIRSVYPSARHDRFIHSLGVYHIGSLIVDHLKREAKEYRYWGETETSMAVIYDSYLAACLLHDVGHAPFSHTFEDYFGQKSILAERLKEVINNESFSADLNKTMGMDEPNFHEFMSAIIAGNKFKTGLQRMSIDSEFVARMITGVFYDGDKDNHQIHNCFISLLHGNIIDADRLDYACRDVWASGYSTSSIDLRRLISALHIKKNREEDYVACFESNSLNEIESVLNVKDFQMKYVINHHTVNYEQFLLRKAACEMALAYYPDEKDEEDGFLALGKIINENSIVDKTKLPSTNLIVQNISDDDLIFLMKQTTNDYYEEWSSRQYRYFPLWKSRDEFAYYFMGYNRDVQVDQNEYRKAVTAILIGAGEQENDILITTAKFKPRVKMDSLYIVVADSVVRFTEIYPTMKDVNRDQLFYYVFLRKHNNESLESLESRKQKCINSLRSVILMLYKPVGKDKK